MVCTYDHRYPNGDLTRQLQASRKTIAAFDKEYELGQRSLIDLLNAQNQYFNTAVSLTSARGVVVFADYQLLAAMGTLLEYLKAPPPVDAAPLDSIPLGLVGYKLPTLRITLPQSGSEPLRVADVGPLGVAPAHVVSALAAGEHQEFKDRWASSTTSVTSMIGVSEWLAAKKAPATDQPTVLYGDGDAGQQPLSYASTEQGKPFWLLTAFPTDRK